RVTDVALGSFGVAIPPSETVNHLVRFLSTWSGSDKFFGVVQYTLKLLVPFLHFRARLQQRVGLSKTGVSPSALSLAKLADLVGDAKMLMRFWGLLPIVQWMMSLERNPPPTKRLQNIERLQGWSMLGYYPFEHLYYLRAHDIIPATLPLLALGVPKPATLNLHAGKLAMWSTRFWAAYVVLQIAHLWEDRGLLIQKERQLKVGNKRLDVEEKRDLENKWDALLNELVVNIGNLPLAIHWSLQKGIFTNDIWTTAFGFLAAVASFRGAWNATALP
ncbi:hypothetical protein CONPUDRAFT_43523, partial [Coniophora puteana RWD-64-598 SS2]